MTRAVVDTNVWVAGLLSSTGAPARLVDLVLRGLIIPVVSPAILDELQEVLQDISAVVAYLRLPGNHVVHVDPAEPEHVCKDLDDDVFTAAAFEGSGEYIVTGNVKHFPSSPWHGIRIVNSKAFLSRSAVLED